MEQYGITELARLFGISTEALRKYEAKGLLESARDRDNQFRKYDMWDIGMLTQIRGLRELDFTLNEIQSLLQDGELSNLETALRQKKESAAAQALKYQAKFRMLEQEERNLHELTGRGDSIWLESRPALYGISIFDRLSMTACQNSVAEQWLEHSPKVSLYSVFDCSGQYQRTLLATEDKSTEWINKENLGEELQYFPIQLCACTILGESYGNFIEDQLRERIGLIQTQGYRVEGDIVAKIILIDKRSGNYFANHRVWIPIEKM